MSNLGVLHELYEKFSVDRPHRPSDHRPVFSDFVLSPAKKKEQEQPKEEAK